MSRCGMMPFRHLKLTGVEWQVNHPSMTSKLIGPMIGNSYGDVAQVEQEIKLVITGINRFAI